jgi:phage baseplate assembly protein V
MTTQQAPNIAVGIVSDNQDPEEMGRVKLTFPWRSSDDESNWARIAQPMAGADRGTWFLPDVGDEVLVAFEGGELAHPYVIGSLWNGQDSPPESNDGDNDVRSVTSREGHTLTFDDADDGGVEIETNAGHRIVLDDSSGSETITIEDTSGSNAIEFDGTAKELSIEAGAKLTIEAPQVELAADGNMTLDASGVLTLNGALIKLN